MSVYDDIRKERDYQDQKWGGPEHDDEHDPMTGHALSTRSTLELFSSRIIRERAENASSALLRSPLPLSSRTTESAGGDDE